MSIGKTVIYVPAGARINLENQSIKDPTVEYESRKSKFTIEDIKTISGGKYGRDSKNINGDST